MTCAGWVHRDISSGNIFAYKTDTGWVAKLAGLEYARRFPLSAGTKPFDDPQTVRRSSLGDCHRLPVLIDLHRGHPILCPMKS